MTIRELRLKIEKELKDAGSSEWANEAEMLLEKASGKSRLNLILDAGRALDSDQEQACLDMLRRRVDGEPLQYIFGETEFMGLPFKVDPRVLIPRQDTELTAEAAVKLIAQSPARVLDLCTGSGALAVSIAKLCPNAKVTASDISRGALEVARSNAVQNLVDIEFIHSDLFEKIQGEFDVIVSNPPYIPTAACKTLDPLVRNNEPDLALDGGEDGLDLIRTILSQLRSHLKPSGTLFMEIGDDQGASLAALAKEQGYSCTIHQDYNHQDRMAEIK